MKSWLQISDPQEFIDTMPLAPVRQPTTDELVTGCDAESVFAALQNKQISAEQAMWLSSHHINWEITK